jgi:hypothetical protein
MDETRRGARRHPRYTSARTAGRDLSRRRGPAWVYHVLALAWSEHSSGVPLANRRRMIVFPTWLDGSGTPRSLAEATKWLAAHHAQFQEVLLQGIAESEVFDGVVIMSGQVGTPLCPACAADNERTLTTEDALRLRILPHADCTCPRPDGIRGVCACEYIGEIGLQSGM